MTALSAIYPLESESKKSASTDFTDDTDSKTATAHPQIPQMAPKKNGNCPSADSADDADWKTNATFLGASHSHPVARQSRRRSCS
jgi:hypothetical protein